MKCTIFIYFNFNFTIFSILSLINGVFIILVYFIKNVIDIVCKNTFIKNLMITILLRNSVLNTYLIAMIRFDKLEMLFVLGKSFGVI